jgi:branched-chain amino acid transport system substrate-binding protein
VGRWAAVVLLGALALPGCGGGGLRAGEVVRVAVFNAPQEALARQAEMFRLGARLAAEEVNAAGGVRGARLDLVFLDGGCDPQRAKSAAQKLVRDAKVGLVLGPLCSGAAQAVEGVLDKADLPALLPVASAEYLACRGPTLFRMVPSDGRQARLLAQYGVREMGLTRVAVLYEDSPFGRVARSGFGEEAARLGLKVLAERGYPQGTEETEEVLRQLAAANPEALFLAGDAKMGAIVARTAARLKLKLRFLATSLMAERLLLELGGEAVEGFTLAEPFIFEPEAPEARQFLERFYERFHRRPTWVAASAYDALRLGAEAMERAGGGRGRLRHALAAMNTAARGYRGVTALTYFDSSGGSQRPVRIVRVEGGAFVPATAQFEPKRK